MLFRSLSGERYYKEAKALLEDFDSELQTKCVGSISERFEGDPPHNPRGSVSHATSVAGLLFINTLINEHAPKKRKTVKKAAPKAEAATAEKPKRKCVRKSVQK